jgi:hypothetical protein
MEVLGYRAPDLATAQAIFPTIRAAARAYLSRKWAVSMDGT